MSAKARKAKEAGVLIDYSALATISSNVSALELDRLFESTTAEAAHSPLDQFLKNADRLNLMYLQGPSSSLDPLLARLILLGYVSAFESFIRALVRGLINIDEFCQKQAESHVVSFGAAIHHTKSRLPEALMEGISLADIDNLKKTFDRYLGLNVDEQLKGVLSEQFRIICQLRHCCAHRFGRLGSQNAIGIGLLKSPHLLEKPLMLDVASLVHIADVLRTFAKSLNNALFQRVMLRTAKQDGSGKAKNNEQFQYPRSWSWKFGSDKRRFAGYYNLFATVEDSIQSPSLRDTYDRFRSSFATQSSRAKV